MWGLEQTLQQRLQLLWICVVRGWRWQYRLRRRLWPFSWVSLWPWVWRVQTFSWWHCLPVSAFFSSFLQVAELPMPQRISLLFLLRFLPWFGWALGRARGVQKRWL